MPLAKNADVCLAEQNGFLRGRLRNEEHILGWKRPRKEGFLAAEMPAHRLIKIELDAAEALAEFSRLAHLPYRKLKWLRKRKRSRRAYNDDADEMIASEVRHTYATNIKASPISDKVDHESSLTYPEIAEDSHIFYSRAESPSSPLPSLQLSCNDVVANEDSEVKPGVRKTKIEETRLTTLMKPKKVAIGRNSRSRSKPSLLLSAVKTEPLCESEIGIKHIKKARSGDLGLSKAQVKCLLNVASNESGVTEEVNFGAVNKPKALLTDTEREARRLRRIQANRESARQTIRRKQILCEELTRKATSLAAENEAMKQKKELLIQELHLLKNKNCQLKHQLGINNSDNSELESLGIDLMGSSQPINATVLQVPTGLPLKASDHLVVWGMAVSQTMQLPNTKLIDENISTRTNDKVSNGNAENETSDSEIHASNETAASEVAEQKSNQTCGRSCSTGSTCMFQKEAETTDAGCGANVFEHAPKNGEQTLQENAGIYARNSSVPPHATSVFVKQPRCDELPVTMITREEMEQYILPALPVALKYGLPYNCNKAMSIKGSVPAHMYIGRKSYVNALAAAEARKRRKELTRNKFPRIRPCRVQQSR